MNQLHSANEEVAKYQLQKKNLNPKISFFKAYHDFWVLAHL